MRINVNDLPIRKDVLRWYIEMNSGGAPHTEKEINRVKQLLKECEEDLNMKYIAGYIYMGSMAEGEMHKFKTFKEAEGWIENELKDVDDKISVDDSWVDFGNECKIKLYTFDCHQYFIIKFQ